MGWEEKTLPATADPDVNAGIQSIVDGVPADTVTDVGEQADLIEEEKTKFEEWGKFFLFQLILPEN